MKDETFEVLPAVQARSEALAETGAGVPADLVRVALETGADVEKLERLLALQERWEATQARRAFFAALTEFQATAPTLLRNAEVDFSTAKGRTAYKFASLSGIAHKIREPLRRCGLSYRFEMADADKLGLRVSCIVTHTGGHSERTELCAPADTTGSKNAIQALGSSVSYMQRYTLLCALGLVTGDVDDDGQASSPPEVISASQVAALRALCADLGNEAALLAWAGVESIAGFPASKYDEAMRVQLKRKAKAKAEADVKADDEDAARADTIAAIERRKAKSPRTYAQAWNSFCVDEGLPPDTAITALEMAQLVTLQRQVSA